MFTRLSSIYFYWNEDHSSSIVHAGQTPRVRWWGDSEQRQAPSATVGTGATSDPWPHRWGSLSGWLSQRLCGPPDHKHSPWAGWTVMDGSPWATRSAQSASCGVNRLTSRRCVYVDARPDNSCSSPEGFVWTSWNKMNMMKLEGIESLNLQVSGGHCLATSRDCTQLLYHLSGPSWWFRKLKLVGICQYSVINTRPRVRLCVCWLCSWWPWVPPAESHCGSSSLRDDISPLNLQSESWHSWECPPASAPTPFLHRAPSLARTCAYTYGRWGCYISVLW